MAVIELNLQTVIVIVVDVAAKIRRQLVIIYTEN